VQKQSVLVICCLLIFGGSSLLLNASTRQYQKAVVVTVENHDPATTLHRKVTDAPDALTEFDANVSIRLNCILYLGRYKSAIDYMPSVFAPEQAVEVSPEKNFLFVKVPGNGDVKLRIVRRDPVTADACSPGK
jgi:hypothetical protein